MTTSLPAEALSGFSNAQNYDTHRPSYIPAAVNSFLNALSLNCESGKHAKILELGAGTGKFTQILAARPEGYEIVAVEPHEEMAKVLEGKGVRGVKVLKGSVYELDKLEVEKEGADAVICAQAFHWFATHEALRQIHASLKPSRYLGLIWNIEDYNQTRDFACRTAWESKLRDATWEFEDGQPRYKNALWQKAFDGQTLFGDVEVKEESFTVWLGKEELWKRVGTMSYIQNLDAERLKGFRELFDEVVDRGEDVVRNEKGEIEVHASVIWAVAKRL